MMMKRIALAVAWIVVAAAIVRGQTKGPSLKPDARTEQELRALRRELMDALKRGDRAILERVLADGFTFIHSTGVLETRQEYIDRAVASAKASPQPDVEFLDDQISVYDKRMAVWITRSFRRAQGENPEINFRGTDVIVKTGGRWRWAAVQSTRLPTRPKPAAIAPGLYKSYAGRYEIGGGKTLTVTEEGETLRGVATGMRPAELIPRSETEFVWFNPDSNVDARIVFIRDESGGVTHAAFRREGVEVWRAKKIME
jgi:hypothetical protein